MSDLLVLYTLAIRFNKHKIRYKIIRPNNQHHLVLKISATSKKQMLNDEKKEETKTRFQCWCISVSVKLKDIVDTFFI